MFIYVYIPLTFINTNIGDLAGDALIQRRGMGRTSALLIPFVSQLFEHVY